MKTTIKLITLIFLSSVMFYSCNDEDLDVVNNSAGFSTGGLIRNDSKLVNYVIGADAEYTFNMLIYQGAVKTTSVDIMKSFTKASGEKSTEILLKNVPVTDTGSSSSFSFSTNYDELIAGLEINGQPLPPADSDLAIADYWTLRYVAKTSEGKSHSNGVTSKLAVSTRLAGNYTITDSQYFHPTAGDQGNFNGPRIIESVANVPEFATYLLTDIGPWTDDRNFFYFYVSNTDDADGTFPITIPKEYNGATQLIWGADEIGLCQFNELPDMPCTNYAKLQDDGHDEMFLNYGYIRDTGTRQFYEFDIKN